jgi:hypothetical protein
MKQGRERAPVNVVAGRDARTAACVSVAWIVLINKPIYPLYVLGLIGAPAAVASCATLLLAPLYAAVPLIARRSGWSARFALPIVGLADTLYETKVFGPASGAELFLFACALLAIVGFGAAEARFSRGLTIVVFLAYAVLHGRLGAPLEAWSADDAARLLELNAFSVASLTAFIGLRFAAVP